MKEEGSEGKREEGRKGRKGQWERESEKVMARRKELDKSWQKTAFCLCNLCLGSLKITGH